MTLERRYQFWMSRAVRGVIALCLALGAPVVLQGQPFIQYLGNAGVRVELGEVVALFDALWVDGSGEYESVPSRLL